MAAPGGMPRFGPAGPASARIHNYLLGGRNYGEADEAAALRLEAICPEVRRMAAVNRMFITHTVGYAAGQGVSQFIDLGCGLPPGPQVHDMAASMLPAAAAAYVDLDELTLGEFDAILGDGEHRDRVGLVPQDLRDPAAVLSDPGLGKVIDLDRPVCIFACLVLHFLPAGEAARVVAGYAERVAAGSFLAVSVLRYGGPGMLAAWRAAFGPAVPREFTPAEMTALFAGQPGRPRRGRLKVVPPGIRPAIGLRPGWQDARQAPPDGAHVVAGIGWKP